jgi:hypothetical protein
METALLTVLAKIIDVPFESEKSCKRQVRDLGGDAKRLRTFEYVTEITSPPMQVAKKTT